MNDNLYNVNRNKRAKTRDALSKFVNSLSISDMDSVRTQLGLLSMISSQTDEISRAFAVNLLNFLSETKTELSSNYLNKKDLIMNQCIRLSQSLVTFSNSRPIKEINLSLVGVQSILGNLRSVNTPFFFLISPYLELRQFKKN